MKNAIRIKTTKMEKYCLVATAVYALVCLFSFLTAYYSDIIITAEHSMNFLDCLFSGNLRGFYDYSVQHHEMYDAQAYYDVSMYIIWGIWNFPAWLLSRHLNIPINNPFMLIWYKLFVVLALIITSYYFYKIVSELSNDMVKAKWSVAIMTSSLLVFVPTLQVAQYDVIYVGLVLAGTCFLIQGKRALFVLAFVLAIPLKFIALIFYIPLVLCSEKKIRNVFVDICAVMIIPFFSRLAFWQSEGYQNVVSFTKEMFQSVFINSDFLILGKNGISLFSFVYCLICIFAFFKSSDDRIDTIKILFYSSLAFFTLCNTTCYWLVAFGIILLLYICCISNDLRRDLLLASAIEIGMFIKGMIVNPHVFGGKNIFSFLLLRQYSKENYRLVDIMEKLGITQYWHILSGIICGLIIALLFYNKTNLKVGQKEVQQDKKVLLGYYCARIIILFGLSCLEVYQNIRL